MKNVIGLVRAKDEERWIARCVASMLEVCEEVMVMDDNSTDATRALALTAGARVIQSPYRDFHETKDKNHLYAVAMATYPDTQWVVMLDGDEMLSPEAVHCLTMVLGSATQLDEVLGIPGPGGSYRLPIVYLWDREDQKRVDRWYANFTRPSVWRVAPNQQFISTYENGLHCGNTPSMGTCVTLNAPVLHFGYMHKEDRIRKFKYYNRIDPNNPFEDGYKHMVLGDLPEYPATMATKWAGPLELAPL